MLITKTTTKVDVVIMAAGETKFLDLKVDKSLLDPNFEGYKLSLDKIPVKELKIDGGVCSYESSDSQWCYKHIQLFSTHNHIHKDIWHAQNTENTVYLFCKDASLYGTAFRTVDNVGKWTDLKKLAEIPLPADTENRGDRYNPSLSFPGPNLALVSDGFGKLMLFDTGSRQNFESQSSWNLEHQEGGICESGVAFVIRDSVCTKNAPERVECLLERVYEHQNTDGALGGIRANFVTVLEWITLQKRGSVWEKVRERRLETRGDLNYAALTKDGQKLCCISTRKVNFLTDSEKEILVQNSSTGGKEVSRKLYSWGQTGDEVCGVFSVEPGVKKDDIIWRLTADQIFLKLDDKELLNGDLGGLVDLDGSTWTLADQRLEVTLSKKNDSASLSSCMWTELVIGDERGEFIADPDLVREASERLRAFTSETDNPESKKPAYNSQELEECDDASDTCFLALIDGDTHSVTYEADLGGHQYLFTIPLNSTHMPSVCLRYDVDGILWTEWNCAEKWTHSSTFNAFGYVQASKEQRKYSTCAVDSSYAAVIEFVRHAYVYWQPSLLESDLRNRKSGKKVPKVAKQQLISLSCTEEIIGVQAFEKVLLLLTKNAVYAAMLIEG